MIKYYPILKKGNSEIKALEELSHQLPELVSVLLPVIEAPQKSDLNKWEKDFNTFGKYLRRKIPNLNFSFQYSTAFSNIDNSEVISWQSSEKQNIIEYIHSKLKESCPSYIPCFNYDDADWILKSIPSKDFDTCIVRIEPYKFETGLDNVIIPGIISRFKKIFPQKNILWMLDFYKNFSDLERVAYLLNLLESPTGKNIIFAATSCPEDANLIEHSSFRIASTRNDIFSFKSLQSEFSDLSFSDYTIRLKPVPSKEQRNQINLDNTYIKIFYTTENNYMIAKSGLIKKQKEESSHITSQEMCKLIINSKNYLGENFSWGDKKINDCANNLLDIHDHQVPIQIGINHHIILTLNQL